jgi:hypothetical protein
MANAIGDPVPMASRVLLRVEYADGQIREFEADGSLYEVRLG